MAALDVLRADRSERSSGEPAAPFAGALKVRRAMRAGKALRLYRKGDLRAARAIACSARHTSVRAALRLRHYSRRTEESYVAWIRRYIVFHGKRHPADMGGPELTAFLSWLAVHGRVAASTQNQALSALLFLYREVLELDVPWLDDVVRAKRPQRLPIVLTREEVRSVLRPLSGAPRLMAFLLYGSGLRLLECCRLRVQDVDFATNQIVVRGAKGDKDRVTILPAEIKADLALHVERVREQHRHDVQHGAGWVELPNALARKYPNAGREWAWQGCSRRRGSTVIRSPANSAGTTCTSPCSSGS